MKFEKLLVEYAENPVNLDMAHPRFSWIVSSEGRGRSQTAYRIIVSSSLKNLKSNKPDLWDSGKIESGETIQHEYLPDNLLSESICFWKVIIWDENGRSLVSPSSGFETAFLPGYNWSASWIGNKKVSEKVPAKGFYMETGEQKKTGDSIDHDGCSLILRHELDITKEIESARVFIAGLGYYEFFINGNRVGDHILSPAKTPYNRYILYDTYDITSLVTEGRNAFGIHLGNGWYNPYKKWWNMYRMQWFGSKKAIAEIHLKYTDGTGTALSSFIVKPFIPDSLSSAKAIAGTIRGRIASEWTLKGDKFTLSVEVPFNTVAKVYVPGDPDGELRESGIPVSESMGIEYLGYVDGYHKMNVSSGTYMFMIVRSETEQENN